MRLYISAIIGVAVLASGTGTAWSQTLADVARKEDDRRKTLRDGAKVYTNKDLGKAPALSPAVPAPTAPAAAPTSPAAEAPPEEKEPPRDQAYWSGRMAELRSQLERDQTYIDALQSRVNALSADFVNMDDPARRAVVERERQKALAELDRLKKTAEDGKKALAELEEEARRAGVPPGWLR